MHLKTISQSERLFFTNKYNTIVASLAILGMIVILAGCSESGKTKEADRVIDPKVEKLKLLADFRADHLYSPGENEQGSWVAMAFDDKGRMIACDQYGYLYRLTIPPVGSDTTQKTSVEKLDIHIEGDTASLKLGYAHGLLYAFNSLYVMVNNRSNENTIKGPGLWRCERSI